MKNCRSICLSLLCLAFTATAAPTDPLETGFQNPPDSAKPLTWWHWLDGSVTKEGIMKDLKAMKPIGLGGSYRLNCSMAMPFGVHNCDDWGLSGGPWITPETSMKLLTWSVKEVAVPLRIDEQVAKPEAKENFYRDIAVIAFPVPQGAKTPHEETLLMDSRPGQSSIRVGDWKLLVNPDEHRRKITSSVVELYDLSKDPGEKHDLAAGQPQRVKDMQARLQALTSNAEFIKHRETEISEP